MSDDAVLDLTFIHDEQRRVEVADDMAMVLDLQSDGSLRWRWDHLCTTFDDATLGHVTKRIAAYISDDRAGGHRIMSTEPLTIDGSLLCLSCNLHGFIRDGRWVPA